MYNLAIYTLLKIDCFTVRAVVKHGCFVFVAVLVIGLNTINEQNQNNKYNAYDSSEFIQNFIELARRILAEEGFSATCDSSRQAVRFSMLHQNRNYEEQSRNKHQNY